MGLQNPEIIIARGEITIEPNRAPFFPEVTREGTRLSLSYMMLGNRKYPRLARGIFSRIMRDAGLQNADETYDAIQHLNREQFYKLLDVTELAAPPLGRLLGKVICFQLKAMSHSIGTRDV